MPYHGRTASCTELYVVGSDDAALGMSAGPPRCTDREDTRVGVCAGASSRAGSTPFAHPPDTTHAVAPAFGKENIPRKHLQVQACRLKLHERDVGQGRHELL